MEYLQLQYSQLPTQPGVYQFLDEKNNVLYVGKAKDLKKRVSSYFLESRVLGDKTRVMVSQIDKIRVTVVESELESLLLEAAYIKKYSPRYNIRLTDGKSYPLIRIPKKVGYSPVLTARRPEDKNSLYFGPYPSSGTMKSVLKIIRRIFPYVSVPKHPKRICLYYHLNLCPCPPVFDSPQLLKEYKRTIRHIVSFLEGDKKKVLKELEKERDEASNMEQFEKAKSIQKKIDAIHYVTSSVHKPFEYETNPNLRSDLRLNELQELQVHLKQAGVTVGTLERIECYDISNFAGKLAVGSMVVFINGEKDGNVYRRFKISEDIVGPNDFAMMEQVLRRRLKHEKDWGLPNLIIVDGGKGQISSALKAVRDSGYLVPVIGLAKREEIIITSDFKEIRLPRDSHALHLMQRIRNEAHRFAITYHKKLRSKAFLTS